MKKVFEAIILGPIFYRFSRNSSPTHEKHPKSSLETPHVPITSRLDEIIAIFAQNSSCSLNNSKYKTYSSQVEFCTSYSLRNFQLFFKPLSAHNAQNSPP